MARTRMAVIGVGHLGKEHARILSGMSDVELVGVVDANAEQARAIAERCQCAPFAHCRELPQLDAAVVAVPTQYHHGVALEMLGRGVSLLIEKPLAVSLAQSDEIVDRAARAGAILQVGHIERFNPAFEELLRHPLQPKFVDCQRCSSYTGRSTDIGAVLDLMIHDIDMLLRLVGSDPVRVEALGVTLFGGQEDVANARVIFANGCVASLTASRASPVAIRQTRIWGPEGYASVDFAKRSLSLAQPSPELRKEGLRLYRPDADSLAQLKNELFSRHFQMLRLDCQGGDQLTHELRHFVDCARTGTTPRVSGFEGRAAMALAMDILEKIRTHAWEGDASGPMGPRWVPEPRGPLFAPEMRPPLAA